MNITIINSYVMEYKGIIDKTIMPDALFRSICVDCKSELQ